MLEQELNDLKVAALEYGHLFMREGWQYVEESSQKLFITALTYLGLCVVFYCGSAYLGKRGFCTNLMSSKRVLIVTAHPDDECMFFGPVILKLSQQRGCRVFLVCLSTGNNAGLGATRKQELWNSCKKLGIQDCDITLCQSTKLPDDPTTRWQADTVGDFVLQHIEALDIDTVITFDKEGVSGHLNHTSLYYAVAYLFLEKNLQSKARVFCLKSTNVLRKYWSLLDAPISFLFSRNCVVLTCGERAVVQAAMKEHWSQLVWFRRLYMTFSRYTLLNTLTQLKQETLELDLSLDE